MRTYETSSKPLAFAQRSTRYTLARQIGVTHGVSVYDVIDTVMLNTLGPVVQGLTLTNAI